MESWELRAAKQVLDGTKKVWSGCYRGKIESIDDPDRLDRVRVRVWALHRDDSNTPDTALPWAEVSEIGGGGYDYGSYNPPPVGSSVWVIFEGGDPHFPVVVGTFRGVPKRNADNPNVYLVKDKKPSTETTWKPPDEETETPKDVFEDVDRGDPHPTKRVWQKSYKGHTIVVEDGDGKESFKLIDRAGQIIEFDCAVDTVYGKGNAAQRGVRDATRGDQLSLDAMRDKRAAIRIRDLSGQEIVLDARSQNESLVIRGRGESGSENTIVLRSGKGKDSIEITDSGGDYIRLDPHSNTPIEIRDSTGNSIVFDKATGAVLLTGSKVNEERVQQKKITVGGKKESDIRGDEIKEILGNKKTKVVNDQLSSVLGNAQVSIGGALKLLLTNASPNGSETKALDIQLTTGSLSLNIKTLGDITLSTTSGDVELSTLLGDAALSAGATLGDANVAAPFATGKVILGSKVLPSGPNPVPGASQEALIRGDFFIQSLDTYLLSMITAWSARAALATTFTGVLSAGLVLLIIPAIGNTLFTILAGGPWAAFIAGESTNMLAQSIAATTFKALLTACKSIKSTTE